MRFLTTFLMLCAVAGAQEKNLDNPLFPQNNSMRNTANAPATPAGQAALLKELGYAGLEGYGPDSHSALKAALDAEGLAMPCNYVRIDLDPDKPAYAPGMKDMIRATSPGEILWMHVHSNTFKNDRLTGDAYATTVFRDLADFAQPFGVKLAVYLHINTYYETVDQGLRIAQLVNRENFGTTITLCHLLATEGSENIPAKIKRSMPHLFAVSISGADGGDTVGMGWDRLIQPLDKGSFDTYDFVRILKDLGYDGPFGLQCYNIKDDCREVLTQSMKTWREYQTRYAQEPAK